MYGHAYGNALHYGLSMFVEFGMYGNRFKHNLNDLWLNSLNIKK